MIKLPFFENMFIEIRTVAKKYIQILSMVLLMITTGLNVSQLSLEIIYRPVFFVFILTICLFFIVSDLKFVVHIDHKNIQVGWKLFSYFKPQQSFESHLLKSLTIQQQPDRYYGIGLELTNQEFIVLDKIAVLSQAKKREIEIRELLQENL